MSSSGFHYGGADLLVNETSSVFNSFCLCTIICARFHYCASNHLYLILNRSGSVCASLSLGCSTTPQSYRVPMNDISRGDVFNNFFSEIEANSGRILADLNNTRHQNS